jgi:uncharacterized membrane protein (UPF0127 family)
MKTTFTTLIAFVLLNVSSVFAGNSDTTDTNFYIGQASFPAGDSIEINSVQWLPDRIVVKGHFNLVSADRAKLAFYITTSTPIEVPNSNKQIVEIYRGEGPFTLTDPNLADGLPHVTMYSDPDEIPFAGVYFGTQEEAAKESALNLGYHRSQTLANSSAGSGPHSDPNEVLMEYLGNPVSRPPDMDERYSAQGLTGAILLAAHSANIQVKNVVIDDSEFPYLVGVICGGSDFVRLKQELKKIAGYEYGGGVGNDVNSDGSDSCNVFNIVPYRAFPDGSVQQIYHRLDLREQVFQEKISSQEEDLVPTHAQPKLPTMTINLGNQTLDAELALTEKEQITGMMFRTNIQETDAMLFVLPYPQRASFWMKNCPESLSAAYIGPDGVIEEIYHLEKNDTTPVYSKNNNIQFVLETRDGWFKRHDIGKGTVVNTANGSLSETFQPNPK